MTTLSINTPMPPPSWALLQKESLKAQSRACECFYDRYFDEKGYMLCVPRWGGDDGPDDAIENLTGWPLLYMMGGPENLLNRCNLAQDGHIRQYTEAKTVDVPFARDGMYYKEFPVMFDWLHNGESMSVFGDLGLCDPGAARIRAAGAAAGPGFYMNEDPGSAGTTTRSTGSSEACSTAAAVPCLERPRPWTGRAIPSRKAVSI